MKTINAKQWKDALHSAANNMNNNMERINALNVFPVPDGDTGSNMFATIENAYRDLDKAEPKSIGEVAHNFSRGSLMSARGNSGVILSQFFKGFAHVFKDKESASTFDVVEAFGSASSFAYKAVLKPVEGTMLTVIRYVAENLARQVTPAHTVTELFQLAMSLARYSCDRTPEQLPILKQVGVVDSGGEGIVIILEGMLRFFENKPITVTNVPTNGFANSFIMENEVWGKDEYGYCTEFIVKINKPSEFDFPKFEKNLQRKGTSIVLVHDEEILKVHIHTLNPGKALNFAQKYGEFIKIKSENMTLQANESNPAKKASDQKITNLYSLPTKETNSSQVVVVSCNVGDGIIAEMKSLGANFIVEGGQSMNPSAKELHDAINESKAEKIIILPNNPNIVLVAQQVAQTTSKQVVVLPTKTQMQGLAAMLVFDHEDTLDNNQKAMSSAMKSVQTGQVTIAVRDTRMDGVSIKKGEYLGLAEKKVVGSSKQFQKVAKSVVDKLMNKKIEVVTMYYGQKAPLQEIEELAKYVAEKYDVEVEIKNGGQPLYQLLISFAKELEWS